MKKNKGGFRFSLRVHPAGSAMLALAFFFLPSDLVIATVLALLWHEGAHVLVMWLAGVKGCSIELTPFGGMADVACYEKLPPVKQALISLAGVVGSAMCAIACVQFAPHAPFWIAFCNMNFSLALINCLPVFPLDGARMVLAIAIHFGVERTFSRGMLLLAYVLGAALVVLGLYGAWLGHINPSLLLLGPYLCYAAHQSTVSGSVRRMQRAHDAKNKLANGEVLPVRVLACTQEPTSTMLTKLMADMPPRQLHILCVMDRESGKMKKILSEQEMASKLFDESFYS